MSHAFKVRDHVRCGTRSAPAQACADCTAAQEFAEGPVELLKLAPEKRTAMMCAEVVWWRGHRPTVSDVLKLRSVEMIHIIDAKHNGASV